MNMSCLRNSLALIAMFCTPAALSDDLTEQLTEYLAAHHANNDFMGEVLIARGDQLLAHAVVGMADIESGRPHQPGDVYHVASVTKQFTGAAIALLAARGQLTLDSTLAEWLPEFVAGIDGTADVTVGMLARHEAGIPDYNGFPEYAINSQRTMTLDNILEWISDNITSISPGAYDYSNSHFAILARIIEVASGSDYREFMRNNVFEPAGMLNTDNYRAEEIVPRRSAGYDPGHSGNLVNAPMLDNSMKLGSGSLHTTAYDLWAWHKALLDDRVLDTAAQSVYLQTSNHAYALGIGVVTEAETGQRVTSHDGKSPGVGAYFKRWLTDGRVLIMLANVNSGALNTLKTDLTRLADGLDVELPERRQYRDIRIEELAAFQGTYLFAPDTQIRIAQQPQGLSLYWGNSGLVQHLAPLAHSDWFHMGSRGDRIRFQRNDIGEVTGLDYDWGGGIEFCPIVPSALL